MTAHRRIRRRRRHHHHPLRHHLPPARLLLPLLRVGAGARPAAATAQATPILIRARGEQRREDRSAWPVSIIVGRDAGHRPFNLAGK